MCYKLRIWRASFFLFFLSGSLLAKDEIRVCGPIKHEDVDVEKYTSRQVSQAKFIFEIMEIDVNERKEIVYRRSPDEIDYELRLEEVESLFYLSGLRCVLNGLIQGDKVFAYEAHIYGSILEHGYYVKNESGEIRILFPIKVLYF